MGLEFTSRERIFETNPVLARHLSDWQEQTYDPDIDTFEPGEEVYLHIGDDKPVVLTKQQAEELNRETEENFSNLRDTFGPLPARMNSGGELYAELPYENIDIFVEELGSRIRGLFQSMGWECLLLISDVKNPYLAQNNDYPPVEQARSELIAMGIKPDFTGGVIMDLTSLQRFFSHIFWIVRCNAMAPYMLFSAPNSATVGTLCKYGNIHFEVYDETEKKRFLEALKNNQFTLAEDNMCCEKFSETGKMEGRKIDLG